MKSRLRWSGLTALVLAAGCADAGPSGLVARAGEHTLTVQEAVDLLAAEEQLPADPAVVRALADLWVDYTVVGLAALEDTTLSNIDLTPLLEPAFEQELVQRYRSEKVQVDTVVSDDELRRLWDEAPPRGRVRARHILLTFPPQATAAQRDSVFALARDLKRRAQGGESFQALARRYSADPGNAEQGGD
ncbi:MAG: hypothetical protein D6701_07215, partial [Gemmatimonadetes bacterium]